MSKLLKAAQAATVSLLVASAALLGTNATAAATPAPLPLHGGGHGGHGGGGHNNGGWNGGGWNNGWNNGGNRPWQQVNWISAAGIGQVPVGGMLLQSPVLGPIIVFVPVATTVVFGPGGLPFC